MDRQKRTVILNYLINHILVLLLPLTLVVIGYFWTLDIVKKRTFEANLAVLQHNMEIMENNMANIESLVYQISINPSINTFLRSISPFDDKTTVVDFVKAQEMLSSFALTNSYIDSIHVYSNRSKIVIDHATTFIRPNFLYELSFSYEGYSYADWINGVLLKTHQKEIWPARNVEVNNNQYRDMLYLQSIPIGDNTQPIGCILVFISEQEYTKLFSTSNVNEGGWHYIKDGNDAILTSSRSFSSAELTSIEQDFGNEKGYIISQVNDQRMFITYIQGQKMPWRYVMAIPYLDVVREVNDLRNLLGLLIALTFAGGIFLAVYMAYKTGRPISNLLVVLAGPTDKPFKFSQDFLETEVARIIQNNASLSRELENTIPAQKTAALYRLLNGEYKEATQLYTDFMRFGIDVRGNFYVVLMVLFNDIDIDSSLEELSAYKVLLNNAISRHISHIIGVYDIDIDRIVMIASSLLENQADLVRTIENGTQAVYEEMTVQHRISVTFAGHIVDELNKVSLAFFYAKQALTSEKTRNSFDVHWYARPNESNEAAYYYPIELEMSLINAATNGNSVLVQKILTNLYKHNGSAPGITRAVQAQFISSLKTTLLRICERAPGIDPSLLARIESMSVNLSENYKIRDAFGDIQARILELCELTDKEDRDRSKGIKRGILSYVNEHYMDAQLSLSMVANIFSISEVYLSRLFKEYTGENFSKYVESLRMKEARRLIETASEPIYKISSLVGYNSPQVFRRVYHKYYGKSPTDT